MWRKKLLEETGNSLALFEFIICFYFYLKGTSYKLTYVLCYCYQSYYDLEVFLNMFGDMKCLVQSDTHCIWFAMDAVWKKVMKQSVNTQKKRKGTEISKVGINSSHNIIDLISHLYP